MTKTANTAQPALATEARRMGAVARLAFARQRHPDLRRKEAESRVLLSAAILEMDAASETGPALHEQAAVNEARDAYLHALADLLRGEPNSCDGNVQ